MVGTEKDVTKKWKENFVLEKFNKENTDGGKYSVFFDSSLESFTCLTTAMVKLEINNHLVGPYKALMNTQPNLKSNDLYRKYKFSTVSTYRKVVGIGGKSNEIKCIVIVQI